MNLTYNLFSRREIKVLELMKILIGVPMGHQRSHKGKRPAQMRAPTGVEKNENYQRSRIKLAVGKSLKRVKTQAVKKALMRAVMRAVQSPEMSVCSLLLMNHSLIMLTQN